MHKALIYYYHYIALKSLNITFKKTSLFSKLIPIVLIIKKIIIINDFLIHFFFKVQRANVSLPLSLAHLSPGSPTTPKRSARINFWISGIYFVYTLFVYIFELFTFYFVYIFRGQSEADSRCHEVRPIPAAQLRQAHLQPTSASAPSSPRYTYIFILFCLLSLIYLFVYIIVCLLFIH